MSAIDECTVLARQLEEFCDRENIELPSESFADDGSWQFEWMGERGRFVISVLGGGFLVYTLIGKKRIKGKLSLTDTLPLEITEILRGLEI